jgi:hypothetical protein
MSLEIRTLETTDGLYINLTDLLKLLKRVYRTTADLTVMRVFQALSEGRLADGEIEIN